MIAPDVAERIRAIFLHHEHRVTPDAAAKLLGWPRAQMNDAIDAGKTTSSIRAAVRR